MTTPPPPEPRPRRPRPPGPLHLRRQGLPGPRRRHPRLGAARQRRPPDGPVVQVPPPARRRLGGLRRAERPLRHPPRPRPLRAQHPRHPPGAPRGARGDEPEPLAVARLRHGRDQRQPRLAVLGRLLLQDLHVAALLLGPRLRAGDPQRRRPRRLPDRARRRPLRLAASPTPTSSSSAPAPPASPRRSPPAAPARRSCSSTSIPSPAARCSPSRRSSSTASPPGTGSPQTLAELAALPNVTVMTRTTAIGYYHQNLVGLSQRLTDHLDTPPPTPPASGCGRSAPGRSSSPRARSRSRWSSTATTAPACMLAGAAQTYLNRYGVKVGNRPAIVTAHDSAWHAAFDLAEAGAKPAVIVDVRATVDPALTDRARALGIETLTGRTVTGTSGRLRVKSLRVNRMESGTAGAPRDIACDAVLMCGGWTPASTSSATPRASSPGTRRCRSTCPARRPRRYKSPAPAAASGASPPRSRMARRRRHAARDAGARGEPADPRGRAGPSPARASRCKELPTDRDPGKAKAFIDFQNDVTAKDIRLAVREGMRSIEHVKRYTTNGMATDQGKMSNVNGLMIAADALGKAPPQVGLTTFRPPYTPDELRHLRRRPQGATFEVDAGGRRSTPSPRPRARPSSPSASGSAPGGSRSRGEDMHAAVARECRAARASVGIFDASTLGKIEVVGPDAVDLHGPDVHQRLGQARAGSLPLRPAAAARTASSATTASSAAWPPTASTSPPRPAARRASSP